ncbi:MAG: hypothetical protein Alpg2KO_09360 [Alphaproteobacteria bacterium]
MDRRAAAMSRLLSQDAVRKMKARAVKRRADILSAALPEDASEELREEARRCLLSMIHNRQRPSKAEFKTLVAEGLETLQAKREGLAGPAFTLEETKNWARKTGELQYRKRADNVFKGRHRIYMPLLEREQTETEQKVCAWLQDQGYSEIAYEDGYAVDPDKQRRRIGRVLRGAGEQDLFDAFTKDNSRSAARQMVVISRHPYDVLRMSTMRGWQSCMTKGGMYWNKVPNDIANGSMVAYLVSENDPNIDDPMSRILLKPYKNDQGEMIWYPGDVYGMGHDGFAKTVKGFVEDTFNLDKQGLFKVNNVYRDGAPQAVRRLPADCRGIKAEQFFDMAGISWHKDEETGAVVVPGDADITGCGVTHLPDMTQVQFQKSLFVGANPLVSLVGCPAEVPGRFSASKTELTSLEGGPQKVGGNFYCYDSKLTSLKGGPQEVGGDYEAYQAKLTSLEGAPKEIKGQFRIFGNPLESLKGGPEKVGTHYVAKDCKLRNLDGIASEIGKTIYLNNNQLVSLVGLPIVANNGLDVSDNQLTSLEGAPIRVTGGFWANDNELETLEGGPLRVTDDYKVNNNRITTMKGAPELVYGRFEIANNQLSDLTGCPRWFGGSFIAPDNQISDLSPLPRAIARHLNLANNRLTSLKGAPVSVGGDVVLRGNKLKDLSGDLIRSNGTIDCTENPMDSLRGPLVYFGHLKTPFGGFSRWSNVPRKLTENFQTSRKHARLAEFEAWEAARVANLKVEDESKRPKAPFRP